MQFSYPSIAFCCTVKLFWRHWSLLSWILDSTDSKACVDVWTNSQDPVKNPDLVLLVALWLSSCLDNVRSYVTIMENVGINAWKDKAANPQLMELKSKEVSCHLCTHDISVQRGTSRYYNTVDLCLCWFIEMWVCMGMNQMLTIYYWRIFQRFNLQWVHQKEKKRPICSLCTLLLETIKVWVGEYGSCLLQSFW